MILAAVTEKGGSGKSTMMTNLAAYWANEGERVLVLDLDAKPSCSQWYMLRQEYEEELATLDVYDLTRLEGAGANRESLDLTSIVERTRGTWDHVLLDVPGADNRLTRGALLACELVVVPLRPGGFDHTDAQPTLELVASMIASRQQHGSYKDLKAALVLTQTRTRSVSARAIRNAYSELGYLEVLKAEMCMLDDYADASQMGMGAIEYNSSGKAAKEVRALAREIEALMA